MPGLREAGGCSTHQSGMSVTVSKEAMFTTGLRTTQAR